MENALTSSMALACPQMSFGARVRVPVESFGHDVVQVTQS